MKLNLNNVLFLVLAYSISLTLLASSNASIDLIWSIDKTFQLPESAVYDAKRNKIYVSNIVRYAKDGSGFISSIDEDGKNLNLKWITNLNSPTGIAVHQDTLYVVDMDALVVIDLNEQAITARIESPASDKSPALNDVAISEAGEVYVSGSNSRQLYRLTDNQLKVFSSDERRLLKANGVLVDGDELIHGGQYWNRWSISTGQLISDSKRPSPASILSDFDGITHDGFGGYFVTVIEDGRIWHILQDGTTKPVSDENIQGIDIYFDTVTSRLFVPRVGGGLSVYQVNRKAAN